MRRFAFQIPRLRFLGILMLLDVYPDHLGLPMCRRHNDRPKAGVSRTRPSGVSSVPAGMMDSQHGALEPIYQPVSPRNQVSHILGVILILAT